MRRGGGRARFAGFLDFGIMPLASMLGERFQVLKMKLEMVIGFRFKRE